MKVHKDDNGDLSSVEINIRCCFDGLPISRSQAKSLCGRVNDFKRISLDFEGVEWMGQGFAHAEGVTLTVTPVQKRKTGTGYRRSGSWPPDES